MITVAMPSWNTPPAYLREAVESVLAQDVPLTLVLVNDASPTWDPLADITDDRLVRFSLAENRGWPYCEALVLAACTTEFFTAHDADDWSDRGRYARLIDAMGDRAAACSPYVLHRPDRDKLKPVVPRPVGHGRLRHTAAHPAHVYRTEALRSVGIPADIRVAIDTSIVSLFWHRHEVAVVDEPLYHVRRWPGSLTQAPSTNHQSPLRQQQAAVCRRRFNEALVHGGPLAGAVPDPADVEALRALL